MLVYLVLLSRTATEEHQVHVALFQDLQNAITVDFGLLYTLRVLFTEGPASALSHIRVVSPADIAQVYMNIMLFVPMGYLLPYASGWFRNRVRLRPVAACFLISVAIENMQLIFLPVPAGSFPQHAVRGGRHGRPGHRHGAYRQRHQHRTADRLL